MSGLKTYASMRESGIPWLGQVPDNWATARIKQNVRDVNEQTKDLEPVHTYITLENVESWTGQIKDSETEVFFESQAKRFKPRDVLFAKLRPYLAKVTIPDCDGLCVGEFLVLRTNNGHLKPRFLERLLRSKRVINTIDASTFGAKMPRANWHFIGNMEIPLPPLDEQAAIVRYLDEADQQIQAYISCQSSGSSPSWKRNGRPSSTKPSPGA